MRKTLSGYGTFLLKIGMPLVMGFVFINTLVLSFRPDRPAGLFVVVLLLGLFFGATLRFAWPLCFATADSKNLYVWSLRGSDRVPLVNLKRVVAISRSRTPMIQMEFDPPTKLGKFLTIIPPMDLSREGLWSVYEFLSEHASNADHDAELPNEQSSSTQKQALLVWLIVVLAIIGLFLLVPQSN